MYTHISVLNECDRIIINNVIVYLTMLIQINKLYSKTKYVSISKEGTVAYCKTLLRSYEEKMNKTTKILSH